MNIAYEPWSCIDRYQVHIIRMDQFRIIGTHTRSVKRIPGLLILPALIIAFIPVVPMAQSGQLDTWFNTIDNEDHGDGFSYLHPFYAWNAPSVKELLLSPDGAILAAGQFTMYNGRSVSGVAKMDLNGKLVDDLEPIDGPNTNLISTFSVWDDGSMIITGAFQAIGTQLRNRIARLHADGSLDTAFDPGIGVNGTINSVAVLPDGRTMIAGSFTEVSGDPYGRIARLLPDGSPDPTFASSIGADLGISALKVLPDGKIIIAGSFDHYNGISTPKIARLWPDGTLDETFDPGSGPDERIGSMDIAPDGSIWITGLFTSYNGVAVSRFARLTSNGALHPGFDPLPATMGINSFLRVDTNGDVYLGNISSYDGTAAGLVKIAPDGSLIGSFSPEIPSIQSNVLTVLPLPDGRLVIGGSFWEIDGKPRHAIACLQPDGSLDNTFNPSRGPSRKVNCLAHYDQERIMVGGEFTHYNDQYYGPLVRLNANGTIDNSFATVLESSPVHDVVVLPDGKVLAGGWFFFNGSGQPDLLRLLADGSLDPTFDVGSGPNNAVEKILVDDEGRIYISGQFSNVDGVPRNRHARLFFDGVLDLEYDPGSIGNSNSSAMAFDPDGKILMMRGGRLVRINEDGSEDLSYGSPTIAGGVEAITSFADGSVLLGGWINAIEQVPYGKFLLKVDPNGIPDLTYMTGEGPDDSVQNIVLMDDGKVIIGGWFEHVDGMPYAGLARLDPNGNLDQSFVSTPGVGDAIQPVVQAILPLSQEKLLIGGGFTSYNGTVKNRLARIMGNVGVSMDEPVSADQLWIAPNPARDHITFNFRSNGKVKIELYDAFGRSVISESAFVNAKASHQIDLSAIASGIYSIVLEDAAGSRTGRIVKH